VVGDLVTHDCLVSNENNTRRKEGTHPS
jgi:hypothetical protein